MKLAWATDIHLDMCSDLVFRERFLPSIGDADALLLTGDIADGRSVEHFLLSLSARLLRPIYFVLGNHDYYHSSIAQVRRTVGALCEVDADLHYLSRGEVIDLGQRVMLVGHDGWGDARLGDFLTSTIDLNDHHLIRELIEDDRRLLMPRLHALGAEAAESLRGSIARAIGLGARQLLVATHVPPFIDASWHQGKTPAPGSEWIPNFTCGATGEALIDLAQKHPGVSFTVLCGHTHGEGFTSLRDNLCVYTGRAEYGLPAPAGWLYPLREKKVYGPDDPPQPAGGLRRWLSGLF